MAGHPSTYKKRKDTKTKKPSKTSEDKTEKKESTDSYTLEELEKIIEESLTREASAAKTSPPATHRPSFLSTEAFNKRRYEAQMARATDAAAAAGDGPSAMDTDDEDVQMKIALEKSINDQQKQRGIKRQAPDEEKSSSEDDESYTKSEGKQPRKKRRTDF